MSHSHFRAPPRCAARRIAGGFARAGAGGHRDPVVARDDRRQQRPRQRARQALQRQPERLQGQRRSTRAAIPRRWPRRSRRSARATRRTSCRCSRSAPATMMAAKGAIKPVYEVMAEAGREVRSEDLRARGRRLLHESEGPDAVVPVQQLDDGVLVQQGRVREGGARSQPRAADLAGSGRRDGQAQGLGSRLPVHDRLADRGRSSKASRPGTTCRSSTKENGFAGPDAEARVQRAGPDAPHREHAGLDQEGLFRLRRPQERARGEVLQRRVRDDDDVVGGLRHDQAEREVQVRRVDAAVLRRRRGRAAEHDHRRREPVGHGAARRRTSTRASPSS